MELLIKTQFFNTYNFFLVLQYFPLFSFALLVSKGAAVDVYCFVGLN